MLALNIVGEQIVFGFYSRKKPTVQLHVNGDAVLSALNSNSLSPSYCIIEDLNPFLYNFSVCACRYALHHSSGRLAPVGRHPAGSITGLTMIDYLALPDNAKVAISYNGEDSGEGFMSIRKL